MANSWRWIGARSVGTSHVKSQLPCQDFGLCAEIPSPDGDIITAIISDGAGTSRFAALGAKIVCTTFMRAIRDYVRSGGVIEKITTNDILDWIDTIRDRIDMFAIKKNARPRDFAATMVSLLAGPRNTIVIHVGDGAAVVREEGTSEWLVPSWPFQGESWLGKTGQRG